MLALSDLPVELLLRIFTCFTLVDTAETRSELRNLRLVSPKFNAIISPVLFHRLGLEFRDINIHVPRLGTDCFRCIEIVVAMGAGRTRAFRGTQYLRLSTHALFSARQNQGQDRVVDHEIEISRQLFVKNIARAISSLQILRAVRWVYDPVHEDVQIAPEVIWGLSMIAAFRELELTFVSGKLPATFTLLPISNLTVLHVNYADMGPARFVSEIGSLITRCPHLSIASFEGSTPQEDGGLSLKDIFTEINRLGITLSLKRLELRGVAIAPEDISAILRQLREIEFLGISRNPSSHATTVFGKICGLLEQQGIFLRGISTDVVHDDALLEFLTVHPGLQELILRPGHSLDNSSELLERIYTRVLPSQRDTLRVLKLGSSDAPRMWVTTPKTEWRGEIVRCCQLRWIQTHYEYTEQLASTFVRLLSLHDPPRLKNGFLEDRVAYDRISAPRARAPPAASLHALYQTVAVLEGKAAQLRNFRNFRI